MITSIFLAKAIGLYFLIIGIAILANIRFFKNFAQDIMNNDILLFLSGVIALILGILLVLTHNIWQMNWTIVITIIAWLTFIKGIVRTVLPNFPRFLMVKKKIRKENSTYYFGSVICILIGIFLCYHGFFAGVGYEQSGY